MTPDAPIGALPGVGQTWRLTDAICASDSGEPAESIAAVAQRAAAYCPMAITVAPEIS